ncbi:MAG: ankyrin repeat domain-containing protein [Flavobacterium sp.]|nr:ankyrin repeat domain-containing protein [Flavobacterium sp.]
MKKSLILGLALITFSGAVNASNQSIQKLISSNISSATPLCVAISKGDVEVVRKFVEYGADVNQKSNGLTPLMLAARYNNIEIIKILLDGGADASVKNDRGLTALKLAELSNASEAVTVLSGKA